MLSGGSSVFQIMNINPNTSAATRPRVKPGIFALCIFASVLSWSANAQQPGLFEYEASYAVRLDELELGTSHRKVTFNDNVYTSVHTVKPNSLAVMFGEKPYQQTSQFTIYESSVFMLESKLEGKDSNPSAVFDWDNSKIVLGNGNSVVLDSKQYLDFEGWMASLQAIDVEQIADTPFFIVQSNKIQEYQYVSVKAALYNVEGTDVDSWLVEMRRVDKENEGFRVWIVSQYRSIPVKIQRFKKGKELTFSIQSLRWLN